MTYKKAWHHSYGAKPPGQLLCRECRTWKDSSLFTKHHGAPDPCCLVCRSAKQSIDFLTNLGVKISTKQVLDKIKAQDGKCAICKKPLDFVSGAKVHIDHDHDSNKLRGILCQKCHAVLSWAKDGEVRKMHTKFYEYMKEAE